MLERHQQATKAAAAFCNLLCRFEVAPVQPAAASHDHFAPSLLCHPNWLCFLTAEELPFLLLLLLVYQPFYFVFSKVVFEGSKLLLLVFISVRPVLHFFSSLRDQQLGFLLPQCMISYSCLLLPWTGRMTLELIKL